MKGTKYQFKGILADSDSDHEPLLSAVPATPAPVTAAKFKVREEEEGRRKGWREGREREGGRKGWREGGREGRKEGRREGSREGGRREGRKEEGREGRERHNEVKRMWVGYDNG